MIITSPSNGYGTDLYSVTDAIEEQLYMDAGKLSEFFWDMAAVDPLVISTDTMETGDS